jgi:hypothetical protein
MNFRYPKRPQTGTLNKFNFDFSGQTISFLFPQRPHLLLEREGKTGTGMQFPESVFFL